MAEISKKFNDLTEDEMSILVELFKVFGDYTRIKVLSFLLDTPSVCVSDLAQALGMTSSAISHQLKILKQSRLVKSKREGKQIYYSLADEHVVLILEKAIEHVLE